jgi:hypothetical protein
MGYYALVSASLVVEHRAPGAREALVEAELLPDLEALLAAERAALDEPVDAPVRETVCVACVVETI